MESFGFGKNIVEVQAVEFAFNEECVEQNQQYGPCYEDNQNSDGNQEDKLSNAKTAIFFDCAFSHYSATSSSCLASNQCNALKVM